MATKKDANKVLNKLCKSLMKQYKSLNLVAVIKNPNKSNDFIICTGLDKTHTNCKNDKKKICDALSIKKSNMGKIKKIPVLLMDTDPIKFQSVTGGDSVSHVFVRGNGNGTLGSFFKVKEQKKALYVISNQHIFNQSIGNKIISPSKNDGGNYKRNGLGKLVWSKQDEYIDAAIGKVNKLKTSDLQPGSHCSNKKINTPINPKVNQVVKLCGSISGLKEGKIISTNCAIKVENQLFFNQIKTTSMSVNGDSGSILVRQKRNRALGLLFAGDGVNYSFHNPLKKVFLEFQKSENLTFCKFF